MAASDSDDDEIEVDKEGQWPTFGSMCMVNGELVIKTSDFEETIHAYIRMLEVKHDGASDSAENTGDEEWSSEDDH
jgi:hypothetical protein